MLNRDYVLLLKYKIKFTLMAQSLLRIKSLLTLHFKIITVIFFWPGTIYFNKLCIINSKPLFLFARASTLTSEQSNSIY